jgi:hypothetical protein
MPSQSKVSLKLWIPAMVSANAGRPLFWVRRFVVVEMLKQGTAKVGAGNTPEWGYAEHR